MSRCGHLQSLHRDIVETSAASLWLRHLVHLHRVVTRTSHRTTQRHLLLDLQNENPRARTTPTMDVARQGSGKMSPTTKGNTSTTNACRFTCIRGFCTISHFTCVLAPVLACSLVLCFSSCPSLILVASPVILVVHLLRLSPFISLSLCQMFFLSSCPCRSHLLPASHSHDMGILELSMLPNLPPFLSNKCALLLAKYRPIFRMTEPREHVRHTLSCSKKMTSNIHTNALQHYNTHHRPPANCFHLGAKCHCVQAYNGSYTACVFQRVQCCL